MECDPNILTNLNDVIHGYVTTEFLMGNIKSGRTVLLRGRKRNVAVGHGVSVKVNTNIGISNMSDPSSEQDKLHELSTIQFRPDLMMDHTIDRNNRDFWKTMIREFDGPVGTLPHYTAYNPVTGLDKVELLERIEEMLEGGVSFMTLHFTADPDIYEIAKRTRSIPVTARGGGLVVRDFLMHGRTENVFRSCAADIAALFKKYDATISMGATYRPPNIDSALDEVHLAETTRQIETIKELKAAGVKVLMEGVGHISIDQISTYVNHISAANCPFMPLGPIVTDSAIGFDHIANAIGSTIMASLGGAHIINSVTREEHTGGVPTIESIFEGLKTARVAAHSVNVSKFANARLLDQLTVAKREEQASCAVSGGLFGAIVGDPQRGCNRCSFECPIVLVPAEPFR